MKIKNKRVPSYKITFQNKKTKKRRSDQKERENTECFSYRVHHVLESASRKTIVRWVVVLIYQPSL